LTPTRGQQILGPHRADEADDLGGRVTLKGHHRQPDDVRLVRSDEAGDRFRDRRLHEDEVRDRDAMMRIDVAGKRGQRAVRHPHRQRRRVLERVGH